MSQERDKNLWQDLCKLFDEHYVCETCYAKYATYLEGCTNPLHAIHEADWEFEAEQRK